MSEDNSKIYLKVGEIEFSIEGSPDYVSKQYKEIERDLNLQEKLTGALGSKEEESTEEPASIKRTRTSTKTKKKSLSTTTKNFSQYLDKLPKGLKNRDKALVAGYYIQQISKDNAFRVRDINNVLKDQGIKLTNPSSLINNVVKSQNVLREVKREGRQKYYQLTKEGEKYIRDLLGVKEK